SFSAEFRNTMALPTLRIIGFILGIFLITLAVSMVVPMLALLAFERTDDLTAFIWASLITFGSGLALVLPGRPRNTNLRTRDTYFLATTSWPTVCWFDVLKMILIQHINYSDPFFETISGTPTAGTSVISGVDAASAAMLMWPSPMSRLGAIGFIGLAVA